MKRFLKYQTKGQSLVLVVFLTAVLFGFLAFSVDMGHIYYMRRWSQNAADAGALAAARQICVYQDQDKAIISAQNYIEGDGTNQFNLPTSVISQTMTSITFGPNGGLAEGEVKVDVAIEHETFAANFFELNTFTELATATAACLVPGGAEGEGVIPVAWECENFDTDTGKCQLDYVSADDKCEVGIDHMYVFFDANANYWCEEYSGIPPDGAIILTCDASNDGKADIQILNPLYDGHKWFWFNIGGGGCTGEELPDAIENGVPIPLYPHEWYPQCEGLIHNLYHALVDYREGEKVIIPVFYPSCEATSPLVFPYNQPYNCNPCPQDVLCTKYDGTPCDPENAGTQWYHLIDFELFKLSCVSDNPQQDCQDLNLHARAWLEAYNLIDPAKPEIGSLIGNEPSFEGCFVGGYDPGLIGSPGGGDPDSAWTISLTR